MFSLLKKLGRASTEDRPLFDPDAPCQWWGEHGDHERRTYVAVTRKCCNTLMRISPTCGLHLDWFSDNNFTSTRAVKCPYCHRTDLARTIVIGTPATPVTGVAPAT